MCCMQAGEITYYRGEAAVWGCGASNIKYKTPKKYTA
jgi:hypothetical protein